MTEQGSSGRAATWRLLGSRPPICSSGVHDAPASLDESARRLSHSEVAVAEMLVGEGHAVRSLLERPGQRRMADLEVCGQSVEVKTWMPPIGGRRRPPNSQSVFNKLTAARGQGLTAVLWARGSGLLSLDARQGVQDFVAAGRLGGIEAVRVVGDGFDLAWGGSGPPLAPAGVTGPRTPVIPSGAARSPYRPSQTPDPARDAARSVGLG